MARLYADENIPLPVVDELRRLGNDVLTIYEDGKGNQRYPDALVLRAAVADGRALLTMNRKHFRRLHLQIPDHAGIIFCTFDPEFTRQARRIHEELSHHESLTGMMINVYREG